MNRPNLLSATLLFGAGLSMAACSSAGTGAAIGAGAGGAAGAGIGAIAGGGKGAAIGAIVGATVGGVTGAIIGKEMDDAADELSDDLDNADVERVGEGILITFDSGILFDVNKAELRPTAKANIDELATVLQGHPGTNVMVVGHTDNTGEHDYNMALSERRAEAVAKYAESKGLSASRIKIKGEGETVPVADNETKAGRQQNRRVEVAVYASEELKEAAEEKAESQS